MSDDVFSRTEAKINKARALKNFDVYGKPLAPLPCDDISTWTSCDSCPRPCEESDSVKFADSEE